jgi:hypothetical protein
LRILADPVNHLHVTSIDQAAIRAAIEERAALLAACEATEAWLADVMHHTEDDLSDEARDILATVRAAIKATKGAT